MTKMQELTKQNFNHFIESGLFSIIGFYSDLDDKSDQMLDVLTEIDQGYQIQVGIVDIVKNDFVKNFGLDEKSPPVAVIFKNDGKPRRAFKDLWSADQIMKVVLQEQQPGNTEDI